jgi:hypothetical protein
LQNAEAEREQAQIIAVNRGSLINVTTSGAEISSAAGDLKKELGTLVGPSRI